MNTQLMYRLACAIAIPLAIGAFAENAVASDIEDVLNKPLVIEKQGSFFVGGHDVTSDNLSTQPGFLPSGTITVDQMYVHYQIPAASGANYPLTLIHGCCLTGKSWETTPDGRMGWDEFFARSGFPVYVVDEPSRGRSASDITAINAVKIQKSSSEKLPNVFYSGREGAWAIFRFGPSYPKTYDGLQYPIEAQAELWKQLVPDWTFNQTTPNPAVPAITELAQKIGKTVLVSHSLAGIYPFQTAAQSTKNVAGIIAIEPAACPKIAEDMTPFKNMPILVLFGDYVDQSPRWAPRLKSCQDFVRVANAAGAKAQITLLPTVGFHGNSHMVMQDRNSLQVASWLVKWISTNIGSALPQ